MRMRVWRLPWSHRRSLSCSRGARLVCCLPIDCIRRELSRSSKKGPAASEAPLQAWNRSCSCPDLDATFPYRPFSTKTFAVVGAQIWCGLLSTAHLCSKSASHLLLVCVRLFALRVVTVV
eukprot:1733560-Prymnesium_polylepis.1